MKATRSGIVEVAVNFALSWDARMADHASSPSTFSSPTDKARLLAIRATGDAVMVGRRTVETDQMEMGLPEGALRSARLARGQSELPLRVVVSGSGKVDLWLKLFRRTFSPIVIFTAGATEAALQERAEVHRVGEGGRVEPRKMLEILASRYGVRRVVCEGGAGLMRSLLEADLVDEVNLTFCPLIFGGEAAPTLTGAVSTMPDFLPESRECRLDSFEVVESECFARYRIIA